MTSRTTEGQRPTGAGVAECSYEGAATQGGRTLENRAARPLMLAVAATVVALMLAAPARAQEATAPDSQGALETTGAESGDGRTKVGDGDAETFDRGRSVRVGDGCVSIEGGDGEDLAVGSCDEADDAEDRSGGEHAAEEARRDGERTAPRDGNERTAIEETVAEETTPEETAPAGETDLGESTAPEGTVQEETRPGDDSDTGAGCPTAPEGETFEASVERAVDGDTLDLAEPVEGLSRVRLVGVDAPELEGEGGEPEPGAEEVASFTASDLEGERVLLELDEEATDPYRRLLAYVWREQEPSRSERTVRGGGESDLFNLTLLEDGHAATMPVEPNTRYAGCFDAAERAAREESGGLEDAGDGPDDEQYGQATGPESTEPGLATPEADEPERTLPEETDAGGMAEEEAPAISNPPSPPSDGPEQTSLEVTEPTEGTTPKVSEAVEPTEGTTARLPEGTGGEMIEVAYGQYEDSEQRMVAEATVPEATQPPSVPEGGPGIEVATEPVAQPAAKPPAASVPALPTRQTPQGPAPVLPETGGAASLPLIVGAVSLAAGLLSLGLLRRGDRRHGFGSDER